MTWFALCESGHPYWQGPDQTTYEDAKNDAVNHDTANHGGVETAGVQQQN